MGICLSAGSARKHPVIICINTLRLRAWLDNSFLSRTAGIVLQCERQPVALWNPHEPPAPPVCGDGGHSCEAGLPGAVGIGMQLPPKEPPPRSAVWRSPWGSGTLFPDPATGGCQECADRQLASDLAAARLRTHEVCLCCYISSAG